MKQCLYSAFNYFDLKAYLKCQRIDIYSFKSMYDFKSDFYLPSILCLYLDKFLMYCPDRSINDISNHIQNVCDEFYQRFC